MFSPQWSSQDRDPSALWICGNAKSYVRSFNRNSFVTWMFGNIKI